MFPPIGLSLFSFGYLGGFARREHERVSPGPVLSVEQLISLTRVHGLRGIELPLARCFPGLPEDSLAQLKERVTAAGLFLSIDAEVVDEDWLPETLTVASKFGESFIRAKLSKTLGGNRYLTGLDHETWFAQTLQRLKHVAPLARDHGMIIAIENHQDVTSAELLRLIGEVGDDVLGVNLDTGSTLATCEDPVEFASAVAPYIRNVHLKDYRLVCGPQGFRLVRCALGCGVVDVAKIFAILRERAPVGVRASIELGAVVAREVHWLTPTYWCAFPPRTVTALTSFLQLLLARLEEDGMSWRTPWERGASADQCEGIELDEVFRSVAFLQSLGAPIRHGLPRALTSLAELASVETVAVP